MKELVTNKDLQKTLKDAATGVVNQLQGRHQ
jgi:hypothetical protein